MIKIKKNDLLLTLLVLGIFGLDMLTKIKILNIFNNQPYPISESISVFGNFFKLTYVKNYGITFGMLNNLPQPQAGILLTGTSLVALYILFYFFKSIQNLVKPKVTILAKISLAMIFGGALGNIIDRMIRGFVVDFLDFGIKNYRWYTFNIADTFIVSGCILLSILMIFFEQKKTDN